MTFWTTSLRLVSATALSLLLATAQGAPEKSLPLRKPHPGTLDDAVGQMMMVGFKGDTLTDDSPIVHAIRDYHIGGVILLSHDTVNGKRVDRNITSPKQLKKLTAQLQAYAKKYGEPPLFIAVNQEGGRVSALHTDKGFHLLRNKSHQKLGESDKGDETYHQALEQGELLKSYGINLNLAPVVDINHDPDSPVIGSLERSYSHKPDHVTLHAVSAIKGYKKAGILCALKHFPGLGSADANTDFANVDVTLSWHMHELFPFQGLISRNVVCDFVMVSHLVNRTLDAEGYPASLSHKVITKLLRKDMGYEGLVMTDDMDAVAIRGQIPIRNAIGLAVSAGNDILLFGGSQGNDPSKDAQLLHDVLMDIAKKNPHIRETVMESYQRIMDVKKKALK